MATHSLPRASALCRSASIFFLLALVTAGCHMGEVALPPKDDASQGFEPSDGGDGGEIADAGAADSGEETPDATPTGDDAGCAVMSCEGKCGPITNFCTKQTLQCGSCPNGKVCNMVSHQCETPKTTCADLGAQCGMVRNSCGWYIPCPGPDSSQIGCSSGMECTYDHQCVPYDPSKNPKTCQDLGYQCGMVWLGIGPTNNLTNCGSCPGQTCNTTYNICEPNCVPESKEVLCAAAGAQCGIITNGCGSYVDCGNCDGILDDQGVPTTCGAAGISNHCATSELPDECLAQNRTCGTILSACGGKTLVCGPPCVCKTCASDYAGKCGSGLDDGCGGKIACGCGTNYACSTSALGEIGQCQAIPQCPAGNDGDKCSNGSSDYFGGRTCSCGGTGSQCNVSATSTDPAPLHSVGVCCVPDLSALCNGKCSQTVTNPCAKNSTLSCSNLCDTAHGYQCITDPSSSNYQKCVATCSTYANRCGQFSDGQGGTVSCPCPTDQLCVNQRCQAGAKCSDYGWGTGNGAQCSNVTRLFLPELSGACPCNYSNGYCITTTGGVRRYQGSGDPKGTCCTNTDLCNNVCNKSIRNSCTDDGTPMINCNCDSTKYCADPSGNLVTGTNPGTCVALRTCAGYNSGSYPGTTATNKTPGDIGSFCNTSGDTTYWNYPAHAINCSCSTSSNRQNNTCNNSTHRCVCTPNTYPSCGSDGCGGTLKCHTGEVCYKSSCCTPSQPSNCGDNGKSDGCGGTMSFPCASGQVCYNYPTSGYGCCTPKKGTKCSDIGQPDGCGGTMTYSCSNAGEICYNGACCLPSCPAPVNGVQLCKGISMCGKTYDCPCTQPYKTCGGGSDPTQCGCTIHPVCTAPGVEVPDGCGGTYSCPG